MHGSPPIVPEDSRGSAQTPMAFIEAIVLAYRRYGADPARALAHAGIPPALLARPEARVTALQMEAMASWAMQELDDEALGWFSRRLPWGSYGLLCRASLTAPDLGLALKRWCRHHRLLTGDVQLDFAVQAGEASLTVREHCALGALREFCLVSLLRYVLGYACWAVDSRLALSAAAFPFAQPAHADVYPLLFEGPIRFGAEAAAVHFDAQYLDLPLRRDETALQRMLQRALPLTVLQYRRDRLLIERVRHCLADEDGMAATAERIAARLNVSSRSLYRQLEAEGASLQALKDEARRRRAEFLLARSQRPVKQVAALVGFRNEKSFARAFRGWTGETPSAYRARQLP